MRKVEKYNKMLFGVIPGIIVPIITFIISWNIVYSGTLSEYYERSQSLSHLSGLISLCILSNLLVFFIAIWLEIYRTARGVILATFIMAIVMLITKFT
ncbi:MAG: hypothetical protein PF450_08215 [Bacteroidales bacterium]|jgi:hypothetical protein|nr:hypothetical protein [Bacteroidales bacterium]